MDTINREMDEYDKEIKRILDENTKDEWLKAHGIDEEKEFKKLRNKIIIFSSIFTITIMVLSILNIMGVGI